MKQQTLIETTIPVRAETLPDIKDDGTYELLWEWSGSYVRLIFESADLIHEMMGKVVALETARRQAQDAKATA